MLQVKASLDDHMDVLYYEVQMINRVFDEFSTSTQIGKNARLECFLLHLRNLIDFFFEPHPRPDDLNVSDFRDRAGKPLPVESVPSTMPKGEISKRVSHMTKKRRTNVEWSCRAWLMQINQTVERFIGQVDDSYFPTKGGRTKQDFLTELKMPIKVSVPVSATSSTCTTIMVSFPPRP